jgi:uncharacterized integral membrane protein
MKTDTRRKTRNIRAIVKAEEADEDQKVAEEQKEADDPRLKGNPWLVLTSTTFLIPATLFAIQGNWLLYASNLAVVTVATVYHASKWPQLYYVDVFTALQLATLHSLYALQKGFWYVPVPGILYSLLMFVYGHQNKQFVWHPTLTHSTIWHMTMHLAVMTSALAVALICQDLQT